MPALPSAEAEHGSHDGQLTTVVWHSSNGVATSLKLTWLSEAHLLLCVAGTPSLAAQAWFQAKLIGTGNGQVPRVLVLMCEDRSFANANQLLEWCKVFSVFEVVFTCSEVLHARQQLMQHGFSAGTSIKEEVGFAVAKGNLEVIKTLDHIRFHQLPETLVQALLCNVGIAESQGTYQHYPSLVELRLLQHLLEEEHKEQRIRHSLVTEHGLSAEVMPILDSLLASSVGGVVVMDSTSRVYFLNPTAQALFQYRYGVVLVPGAIMLDYLPAEQQQRLKNRFRKAFAGERFIVNDSYRNDEGKVFIDYEYSPIFSAGSFWGVVLRLREVTQQRLQEQERLVRERQIRSLTEKIPGVIFQGRASLADGTSIFVYVSPSSINYLGQHPSKIIADQEFLTRCSKDEFGWRQVQQNALKGQDLNYEGPFMLPGLGLRWLLFTAQVSFQTSTSFMYDGLIMDVTDRRQAQLEARERQERLDRLTQSAPGVVFELLVNRSGAISLSYISQGGVELLGLGEEPDDNYASKLISIFSMPENAQAYQALQHSARFMSVWDSEFLVQVGDQQRWLSAHALPERQDGGSTAWYGMMVEVTHLKESERRLTAYAEALQEAQALANLGNFEYQLLPSRVQYHNLALMKILGLNADEDPLAANSFNLFQDRIHPDEITIVRETYMRCKESREDFSLDYRILNFEGQELYLAVRARFVYNPEGEAIGIKGTCQDVTDRKKLEATLVQAREEAVSAANAKTQFLSAMSHEIRTPLNAIIGINNLLLREVQDAAILRRLNTIEFCARNLLNTINKLLDFSKLEAGKYQISLKPLQLRSVLQQVLDLWMVPARDKGLHLDLEVDQDVPAKLLGDENGLQNILNNLLSNAIKFTEHGMVCLTARLAGKDHGQVFVEFKVMDTGLGISPEKQDQVFDIYEQADHNPEFQRGGTGLGLAIVKQLLENMGSKITLESEVGRGTTFSFTLSMAIAEDEVEIVAPEAATGGVSKERMLQVVTGARVLVAEDNEINAMIVQEFLRRWGVETFHASNGDEAVRMATSAGYDMVLMDIQMPILDGIRATRIIRSMAGDWFKQVPIIAFSAFALQETANLAYEVGMSDYLLKPFTPDELLEKCYEYLLPFQQQRAHAKDHKTGDFHIKPHEMAHLNMQMKLGPKDFSIIKDSLDQMVKDFDDALVACDQVLMQRLCHKYIPSLKMLNVEDVWLDLTIARQVVEAGNLTPELRHYYLEEVKRKASHFLEGLAE